MNKEIKAKWIAALRRGEYPQTRGKLTDGEGYCCLGVLAKIQGAPVEELVQKSTSLDYEGRNYRAGLSRKDCALLAEMNDGDGCEPKSFDHIARYVQAMVEEE